VFISDMTLNNWSPDCAADCPIVGGGLKPGGGENQDGCWKKAAGNP